MAKHCGSCIHWRDVLTGWCDYYSWPMDADDTEPCKAYKKNKEEVSMGYRPEYRLSRKGNDFVYECPKDEEVFGGWLRKERSVRIRLVSKKYDDIDPATEIIWLFVACEVAYDRLKACQLILDKNLKIKIEDYGEMTLETDEDQCIKAVIAINSHKTVKDVIPKVLYMLNSKELEWIIWQAISCLQDKAKEMDKEEDQ